MDVSFNMRSKSMVDVMQCCVLQEPVPQAAGGSGQAPPSDEFADSGNEDTSKDADLQQVDADLRALLPGYDMKVGTVNFGSRGMTDKRNDFLEGTSGSNFGGAATSAPGSS